MKMLAGFALGVLFTLLLIGAIGYLAVTNGWIPAAGDSPPLPLERWAARNALNAVLKSGANDKSSLQSDEATLLAGAKVYATNCAVCHGSPKNPKPTIATGLYPKPTLFAKHQVTDDPEAETYWKVNHGIKFTGMPSFNKSLSEKEMWQVTLFLKHMDKLPPPVQETWNSMQ